MFVGYELGIECIRGVISPNNRRMTRGTIWDESGGVDGLDYM